MAQSFKETAHLRTNKKNFDEGYERIFGDKKSVGTEEEEEDFKEGWSYEEGENEESK